MRNLLLISVASLILGLSFDYFFFDKVPGLSFPLYVLLILAGLFISSKFFNKRSSNEALWLLAPLLFFSAMVFVRASTFLTFLNVAASLFLLLLIADIFLEGKIKSFFVSDYIKVFFLPLMFLSPLSQSLTDLFSWNKEDANKKTLWQIVKGVIISAPFLIIFIILFSSADLIFDKYLSNIIDFKINREIVLRSLLIMAITLGFIGAYSYIFRFERKAKILKDAKDYNISFIEGYIVLGSVNILFFIFIAIQLAYLFGGEVSIISQGFTYAQYARRGFFELIAVAIISFLLLFGMDKFIPKKEEGYASIFKILASALILQVILIMISAHTRLTLYETAYGMTILRLYSHVFIVFLATIFFLMSYKIFRDRRENVFAFRVFAVAVLFLAFMNLFNPDAFIANRNIESFYATGKLDIHYLALLSDDALTASMKVFELPDQELKNNFSEELAKRAQEKKAPYFSRWQSLNISRMKGAKVLGQFLSAQ